MNFSCCNNASILEHGVKVVKKVLEKRLCEMVVVSIMQFGFMPEKGSIESVYLNRVAIVVSY